MRLASLALLFGLLAAQDRAPQVAPATPPQTATPQTEQPAAPAVLEYKGKPLVAPFQCTADDVQLAGLSCTEEEPCPLYLELAAVSGAGNRIVVGGNFHSAAVTMASALFASEDAGRTWRETADHIRSAAIDRVQFLDNDTGWAAGEKVSPLPQDPFLLLTTDGGRSWRTRPIFGDSAENKLGSIQQFSFSAKDAGSLIVDRGRGADGDRYELYESPDGGESWSFRQSSQKPLTLRRPAPVLTDWRLRADNRTRAYHVEHRQGERWASVAEFAVRLGLCKP